MEITQDELDKITLQNLVDAAATRPHIAALLNGIKKGVPVVIFLPNTDATQIETDSPRVVYIGADMPGIPFDPAMFDKPSLDHIFSNARSVLFQVAAPSAAMYAGSVFIAATTNGIAVIVEVAEEHEIVWHDYIKKTALHASVMWITPRNTGHVQ